MQYQEYRPPNQSQPPQPQGQPQQQMYAQAPPPAGPVDIYALGNAPAPAQKGGGGRFFIGLIVGLVMSPMADYWVPMVGSAIAIIVAKAPFGGTGRNVFNPAAVGLAVLTFCFPEQMFTYPALSAGPLPLEMSIHDVVVMVKPTASRPASTVTE